MRPCRREIPITFPSPSNTFFPHQLSIPITSQKESTDTTTNLEDPEIRWRTARRRRFIKRQRELSSMARRNMQSGEATMREILEDDWKGRVRVSVMMRSVTKIQIRDGETEKSREMGGDAVIYQLLPQAASGNQSFMIKILQNSDSRLRTAAVWTLVNLTSPTYAGAFNRVVKLRHAGIVSQLKSMVNDPCLDLQARTALGQSMTFGDGST